MDKDELTKWMKTHGVDEQMRVWLVNDIAGRGEYGVLEDLATVGSAIIKITMLPSGALTMQKISQYPEAPTIEVAEPTLSVEPEPKEEGPKLRRRKSSV
jgi:hypothetical protein